MLGINKNKSLYYPQEKVENDTLQEQKIINGRNYIKENVKYYDTEIIYKDYLNKIKITSLKKIFV